MTTVGTVLVVWGAVLAVLVAALALGTRRRRPGGLETVDRRAAAGDRRGHAGDRRMGLPDIRIDRVERRAGSRDRRSGAVDRRRTLGSI